LPFACPGWPGREGGEAPVGGKHPGQDADAGVGDLTDGAGDPIKNGDWEPIPGSGLFEVEGGHDPFGVPWPLEGVAPL